VTNQITSFGTTPSLEDLKLPGDRRCGDLSQGPLYGELAKLVPGFNHGWGRNLALALYSRHLQKNSSRSRASCYLGLP
jgi:hypothetical protein